MPPACGPLVAPTLGRRARVSPASSWPSENQDRVLALS